MMDILYYIHLKSYFWTIQIDRLYRFGAYASSSIDTFHECLKNVHFARSFIIVLCYRKIGEVMKLPFNIETIKGL